MKKRVLLLFGVIVVAVCAIFACACLAPSTSASATTVTLDDFGLPNRNLVNNYNLLPEKIYSFFNGSMTTVNVDGFYNNNSNIEHWLQDLGDGTYSYTDFPLVSSSNAWFGLNYYFRTLSSGTYTLTICVKNDVPLANGIRLFNGSGFDVVNGFERISVPASTETNASGFIIHSVTFNVASDYSRCFYYIWGAEAGSFVLSHFKLEHGSNFTGFTSYDLDLPNHDDLSNFVYSSTYADFRSSSFVDGYQSGSSYTVGDVTINANNMSFDSTYGLTSTVTPSTVISFLVSNLNTSHNYSFSCYVSSLSSNVYPVLTIQGYNLQLTQGYNYLKLSSFADSTTTITISFRGSFSSSSFNLQNIYLNNGRLLPAFPYSNSDSNVSYGLGYDTGYASGYNIGSDEGFLNGYDVGLQTGITDGYDEGYSEGDSAGYSRGLETARNGNWWQVMTALVNVPVKAIIGFFDIEILGFNVLNLFRTIILISLFIFVVNLLLKKLV